MSSVQVIRGILNLKENVTPHTEQYLKTLSPLIGSNLTDHALLLLANYSSDLNSLNTFTSFLNAVEEAATIDISMADIICTVAQLAPEDFCDPERGLAMAMHWLSKKLKLDRPVLNKILRLVKPQEFREKAMHVIVEFALQNDLFNSKYVTVYGLLLKPYLPRIKMDSTEMLGELWLRLPDHMLPYYDISLERFRGQPKYANALWHMYMVKDNSEVREEMWRLTNLVNREMYPYINAAVKTQGDLVFLPGTHELVANALNNDMDFDLLLSLACALPDKFYQLFPNLNLPPQHITDISCALLGEVTPYTSQFLSALMTELETNTITRQTRACAHGIDVIMNNSRAEYDYEPLFTALMKRLPMETKLSNTWTLYTLVRMAIKHPKSLPISQDELVLLVLKYLPSKEFNAEYIFILNWLSSVPLPQSASEILESVWDQHHRAFKDPLGNEEAMAAFMRAQQRANVTFE